jgi:hypothetical protein
VYIFVLTVGERERERSKTDIQRAWTARGPRHEREPTRVLLPGPKPESGSGVGEDDDGK